MSRLTLLALTDDDGAPNKTTFLLNSAHDMGWRVHIMRLNRSLRLDRESAYAAKIPKALSVLRNDTSNDSIYMMIDAFDTFLLSTPKQALKTFYSLNSSVVWAAETWMVYNQGIDKALFDDRAVIEPGTHDLSAKRMECINGVCRHRHRYLNAGGVIGYRQSLINMFEHIESIRDGAPGWRNRRNVCVRAKARQCAEQWAALRVLSHMSWKELGVTLDYESKLFYTADWSVERCLQQVKTLTPAVLHMTFIAAPKVRNTFNRLYDRLVLKRSVPTHKECLREEALCASHRTRLIDMLQRAETCPDASTGLSCDHDTCGLQLTGMCDMSVNATLRSRFFDAFVTGVRRKLPLQRVIAAPNDKPEWLKPFWNMYPYCYYGGAHRIGLNSVWC